MKQEAIPQPDGCKVSISIEQNLSPQQLADWLTLILTPGLGAISRNKLLEEYTDASRIREASQQGSLPGKIRRSFLLDRTKTVDACLQWQASKSNRHIICINDARYPALLKEIPDPPPLLFIEGRYEALHQAQLAIVGSRKATPPGLETTRQFARALGQHGLTITSGLALGIDASAHIGCLDVKGQTVAVLGNGLDKIYPARHQSLAEEIVENSGAIVSEFIPGTPPLAQNFPRRNRLISGLSLGVLVVEAAVRSGSLITARLAGEQGREVFAIPGSIHNPLARGAHRLLREGAVLVENVDDILNELGSIATASSTVSPPAEKSTSPAAPEQQALLEYMGFDPVDTDTLVSRSGLTAERVSSMLLLLELQGNIAALGGGHFQRSE